MAEAAVTMTNVQKSYRSSSNEGVTRVLDSFTLSVSSGRIVSLYGPNGCGKTTLLNLLAGLDQADEGYIEYRKGGRSPRVGYAFQDYHKSLLPWCTALDNVAFPFLARGETKATSRERARDFLLRMGLTVAHQAYPYQLSSGQQQAVALAAALAPLPDIVLLDEAFSAFDHRARASMQRKIRELINGKTSAVVVTHDIDEALLLSDELVLLTPRPARVIEVFPVPFPRPRSQDLLVDESFGQLRRRIIKRFLEEFGA